LTYEAPVNSSRKLPHKAITVVSLQQQLHAVWFNVFHLLMDYSTLHFYEAFTWGLGPLTKEKNPLNFVTKMKSINQIAVKYCTLQAVSGYCWTELQRVER